MTDTSKVPARPWKATFNKKFGSWAIHHQQWCERGETSRLFGIDVSTDPEADKQIAEFVVDAVNERDELIAALRDIRSEFADDAERFPVVAGVRLARTQKRVNKAHKVVDCIDAILAKVQS